jgi:hypothetical protein
VADHGGGGDRYDGVLAGEAVARRATPGAADRHQSVETLTISYNGIGHMRFGAVEWRND